MRAQRGVLENKPHPLLYPKSSAFLQEALQSLRQPLSLLAIQPKGAPPMLSPLTHCPCTLSHTTAEENTASV